MSYNVPCPRCGEPIDSQAVKCPYCRSYIRRQGPATPPPPPGAGRYSYSRQGGSWSQYQEEAFLRNDFFAECPEGKNRGLAALFAIFLGGLGVHYFYMGKTTAGIIYLLLWLVTCSTVTPILGLIQGIMMICMTNTEWRQRYILNPSTFPF